MEQEITRSFSELSSRDIQVKPSGESKKFALADMAALGAGFQFFAGIAESLASQGSGEILYRLIPHEGSLGLQKAKNELLWGAEKVQGSTNKMAQFMPAEGASTAIASVNPAVLMVAVAFMEVNRKLDAIQTTQKEMFEYLKNKDKAQLRGNLETLSEIFSNYQFNWDNQKYKTNKHILVQDIRNDAESDIIQCRAQVRKALEKVKEFSMIHSDVRESVELVQEEFEEYRLAVYLFAFASFLEVMLLENYNSDYLDATIAKIDKYSNEYRFLYTDVYDTIEEYAGKVLGDKALAGLAGGIGLLGKGIEKIAMIGDHVEVDEKLIATKDKMLASIERKKKTMMREFSEVCSSDIRPFADNIKCLDALYNTPCQITADDKNLYLDFVA